MSETAVKLMPTTVEEIEAARQNLYDKLEAAENQPLSEKAKRRLRRICC